jgi:mono/diheme cytochrome c family protein
MLAFVAAVAVGAAASNYLFSRFGGPDGADPANAAQVAKGKAIYARDCASCHGSALQGQPNWRTRNPDGSFPAPPHDATGHTWHHADAQLFEITKAGGRSSPGFRSGMPAFGGKLNDAEIWAVLAFIKSRWPPPLRERQAVVSSQYDAQKRR